MWLGRYGALRKGVSVEGKCSQVPNHVEGDLKAWSDVPDEGWSTLLVGNGLSINLWSRFGYGRLRDNATLDEEAADLFDELGTNDFEEVMGKLLDARRLCRLHGMAADRLDLSYTSIKDSLFHAVSTAHVEWSDICDLQLPRIADELAQFSSVFTTNYDLCLYWATRVYQGPDTMCDYFWNAGNVFDPENIALKPRYRPVHYLHGGLHLWQDVGGANGKWTRGGGKGAKEVKLLDLVGQYTPDSQRRPLFVSEGSAREKEATIKASPYLSFCLDRLREDDKPLVVFGHALSEQDAHIYRAVRAGGSHAIAVGIHSSEGPDRVTEARARVRRVLGENGKRNVYFFDSRTHPLGDPSLHVPDPEAAGS